MADTPDSEAGSQTQPAPPPPTKEPVVYPTIGTEKVIEHGRKPDGTTREGRPHTF